MTNAEIVSDYRQAKNKRTQIKILAELNTVDVCVIKEILREAGEKLPGCRSCIDGTKVDALYREGRADDVCQRIEALLVALPAGSSEATLPPPVSWPAACCGMPWAGAALIQQATNCGVTIQLDRGLPPLSTPRKGDDLQ